MLGISDLVDSDMEEAPSYIDENSLLSSTEGSASKSKAPAKKVKKRKCVTMPKTKSRVTKSSPVPKRKLATMRDTIGKDTAIEHYLDEDAVVETQAESRAQEQMLEPQTQPKSRGRPRAKPKATQVDKQHRDEAGSENADLAPMVARSSHAANKSKNPAPEIIKPSRAPAKKRVQSSVNEKGELGDNGSEVDELEAMVPIARRAGGRPNSHAWQESSYRHRAGSASDTERGDPNLRRRLGDITRKFENIDARYRDLKEVGVVEAGANMEKLRRQCDAAVEASNNLVASLKKELAVSAPLAQDARRLRSELETERAEAVSLRRAQTELSASLTAAQNEIKALQAKLAAARKTTIDPVAPTSNKTPKASANRPVMSAIHSMESTQTAQMKLDLYSDLSGLIIRNVKRAEDGDTYDCIQTGRNGTLHFKLFIDAEDAKTASFEETEFLYTPLLDANRDREMIELMPSYLTEDITFARQNAAKFYQRVVDTLTKRVERELEE